jgi:hypothetical protein
MANTSAPFGFQLAGFLDGRTGSLGQSTYLIASGDTNYYFTGDPVSLSNGYVTTATAGANELLGVFIGCEFYNSAVGRPTWSPFWPASTTLPSGQAAAAYVIADPQATFVVQSSGSAAVSQANVGKNIDFAGASPASPSSAQLLSGQSVAYANQANISAATAYAFRILGLVTQPPGAPGTDTTTAYNRILVGFNNQAFRTTTGL